MSENERFSVVMNEFDEVEYITDIVDCEDRDFADFIDFANEIAKENEKLQKESYGNLDGLNYYQEQNGHLSSKISDLECENEQLKQSEASTLREFAKGTRKIQKLVKENKQLIDELEEKHEQLEKEIKNFEQKVNDLNEKIYELIPFDMDKEGNININGKMNIQDSVINFLKDVQDEPDDIINHFKSKINIVGMLSDYYGFGNVIVYKGVATFKCESHEEAKKLFNHIIKQEHLLLMYMYLTEFMKYHQIHENDFEQIINLIWED